MALQVCDTIQRKEDLIDGIVKHSLAFEMSWYISSREKGLIRPFLGQWNEYDDDVQAETRDPKQVMAQGVEDIGLLY